MKRNKTTALLLKRTNFKDSDKIVKMLTKDYGRLSAIVKGARKSTSRMAGGIQPFAVAKIQFIASQRDLKTLVSAQVDEYFATLAVDYPRARLAGDLLAQLDELIEDEVDASYFNLCRAMFRSLDDPEISPVIVEVWFNLNLLSLLGRAPDLLHDKAGAKLDAHKIYHFDPTQGSFSDSQNGQFKAENIKAWRVLMTSDPIKATEAVSGLEEAAAPTVEPLKLFIAESNF